MQRATPPHFRGVWPFLWCCSLVYQCRGSAMKPTGLPLTFFWHFTVWMWWPRVWHKLSHLQRLMGQSHHLSLCKAAGGEGRLHTAASPIMAPERVTTSAGLLVLLRSDELTNPKLILLTFLCFASCLPEHMDIQYGHKWTRGHGRSGPVGSSYWMYFFCRALQLWKHLIGVKIRNESGGNTHV